MHPNPFLLPSSSAMRPLPVLLVPLVTFSLAIGAPHSAPAEAPDPIPLGKLCAASTKAEKSKDYAAAISAMKSYQQRGGDPFIATLRLGWLYFQAAQYADAAQAYHQASVLQPTSLNALLGSLNAAQAMLDIRNTARAADAVLHVDPNNYLALMALGGLHFAQKEYDKATVDYFRVLVHYPDDPDALSGAAWSALRAGDPATAHPKFTLLLEINPDYPQAREGYGLSARSHR